MTAAEKVLNWIELYKSQNGIYPSQEGIIAQLEMAIQAENSNHK